MNDLFIDKINDLYNLIVQPIDITYKKIAIRNYKNIMDMPNEISFGNMYNEILDNKTNGVVYTPGYIANYMIENTIKIEDIINNPYIKIIDPSCGCGNIIISCFEYIYNLYINNLDIINKKNNLDLNKDNLNEHIINNNIYGVDIDLNAIKILIIDLFNLTGVLSKNINYSDFLIGNIETEFDIFIGNPPYIGHKDIGKEYFLILKEDYKEIYKNKGDIYYCFFKAAYNKVKRGGKVTFITSRYFLESQSGEGLRTYINNNFCINKVIDFYGIRPFKKVGIDPIIIFIQKYLNEKIDTKSSKNVEIIKPVINIKNSKKVFINSLFLNRDCSYNKFYINQCEFANSRWILQKKERIDIVKKIEEKCNLTLKDICVSHQGIITGCDKAFIVDEFQIKKESLEDEILRPWIKSSYIKKEEHKNYIDKFIIYSNDIENIDEYPNIKRHLFSYKSKLMNRRECKKGIRKWYELQWGREKDIFQNTKIIFPYKSNSNKFTISKGKYFSADIYCIVLKNNIDYDYDFLIKLLNSRLYEFYFQSFGKKLGEDLFEYYPNTLMDLKIPPMFQENMKIDDIYNFFKISKEEIDLIEKI